MHNGAAKLIDAAFNGNSAANDLATATDNDDSLVEGSLVLARTAPLADAGADQLVNEGALVTLDGSGSFDSDGEPLCFAWQQVGGPPVTLALTSPAQPTFTAPAVPVGGATLTFRLTVTDPAGVEHADTVDITIKNVNNVPVADAGDDQTVAEGTLVTLDGSGSFDSDGELLGYQWAQTAGSPVALSNATAITPTFTAPLVGVAGETLTFQLTVDDGIDSASDTVSVFVEDVNHPPVANAGEDRTVSEGTLVGLDGSASTDPDGDTPAYSWRQVPGTTVVLANATTATPSFTAPAQSPGAQDTLIFEVTVSDGRGGSATDEVSITVRDLNAPPDCSRATASPLSLWPPNHKMVPVQITGVTDPEDPVRLTISAVRQDEPTNGLGDGDSAPDAAINPDGSFLLRAERSGKGDGRVYHVSFVASDGFGGECTGAVRVCVPHSARRACGDGGALYDSTQP